MRDPWTMHPTMAVGVVAVSGIAGFALPMEGATWGAVFLLAVPVFAYFGIRGWRQGMRF